jgi:hypothetical protein
MHVSSVVSSTLAYLFTTKLLHGFNDTTVRTTRLLGQLPDGLTGYLNTNNQEVAPGLVSTVRGWLGFSPASPKPPSSSSMEMEDESEHFEQEGDFDIRLSEADSLQSIEDDIKRTQLFNAMDELRQSVRLNHVTPFSPKWDDSMLCVV